MISFECELLCRTHFFSFLWTRQCNTEHRDTFSFVDNKCRFFVLCKCSRMKRKAEKKKNDTTLHVYKSKVFFLLSYIQSYTDAAIDNSLYFSTAHEKLEGYNYFIQKCSIKRK